MSGEWCEQYYTHFVLVLHLTSSLISSICYLGFQDASITKGSSRNLDHCANEILDRDGSANELSGMMLIFGVTSLAVSLLDIKPYCHLQLVPHITKYHQVSPVSSTISFIASARRT